MEGSAADPARALLEPRKPCSPPPATPGNLGIMKEAVPTEGKTWRDMVCYAVAYDEYFEATVEMVSASGYVFAASANHFICV